MKINIAILFILSVILISGCRRTDIHDFTVDIPMLNAGNTNAVFQAVAGFIPAPSNSRLELPIFKGVDRSSVRFDLEQHQMYLRYDSMQVAKKNIEMAVAKIGLTANGVTPESIGAKSVVTGK